MQTSSFQVCGPTAAFAYAAARRRRVALRAASTLHRTELGQLSLRRVLYLLVSLVEGAGWGSS